MIIIFYSIITTLSIIFLWLKHPIRIGLILILQTINIAIITGIILSNFFFSYIIIIIILRGALVLFIYIARIASNEKFYTPIKIIIVYFIIIRIIMYLSKDIDIIYYPKNTNIKYDIITLIKLFNSSSAYITIIIIIYLLLTIIIVSYIANRQEGPLRIKIYE